MSKTNAQLEAENAVLREENEALRSVLAAIGEGMPPLPADAEEMPLFYRESASRMSSATIDARLGAAYRKDYIAGVLREKAAWLRKEWTRPLRYVPEEPAPLEGKITGKPADAPYAEKLTVAAAPAKHCGAKNPSTKAACTRLAGHRGGHTHTASGAYWRDVPEPEGCTARHPVLGFGCEAHDADGNHVAPGLEPGDDDIRWITEPAASRS